MLPPSAQRPPGWYGDPDDPTCVRHWSGQTWSDRRRVRPGWDLPGSDWVAPPIPGDTGGPVLEGPARSPGLPAIAAAASGRPGTRAMSNPRQRVQGPAGTSTRPDGGAYPPTLNFGTPSWNPRRPVLVIVGIVLIALIALGAAVTLTSPIHVVPWSVDDPQFLTDANGLCAKTLPPARPSTSATMTAGTATPSLSAVTHWVATVRQVGGQILTLPSLPDDVGRVNIWLDNWQSYGADETNYANWLQTNPGHPSASELETGAALATKAEGDANRADAFAESNGLRECVLAPAATPAAGSASA